ncbi:TPA: hypothetical protein HA281_04340 [Candidatus Woesearchaeota archaeon]|nr:hypothetical protein [Candidatus Woesearchaeota archaeon]HII64644.1 hypothetical protein [Candidatus Woesearchaeota archaeon]
MAFTIDALTELENVPVGAVVYYKQGRVLDTWSDLYDIGIVVPSPFPPSLVSAVKRGLVHAVNEAYGSNEMNTIRKLGKPYTSNWDQPADSATFLEGWEGSHPNKTLIVTSAPVPEDGSLARRFALELERRLLMSIDNFPNLKQINKS